MQLLVDQQLGAPHADAVQHVQNILEELDEVDGARQLVVPKMTRAAVIRLATAAACLAVVENAHARIKESSNPRLVSVVGAAVGDLDDRAPLDLFRAENPELDTHHGLNIRIWTMNTGGHLFSVSEGGF